MSFGGPSHFCVINTFPIEAADFLARSFDRLVDVGDGNTGEQSDDGNDYHDFNEGESALSFYFHNTVCLWFRFAADEALI